MAGGEFHGFEQLFLGFPPKTWGSFSCDSGAVWQMWGLALLSALPTSQISPLCLHLHWHQMGTQVREKILNYLHSAKKSC